MTGSDQSASVTLVLGGQRSGKSAFAEMLAGRLGRRGVYLATTDPLALAEDSELAERVRLHRERRGAFWRTIEEPIAVEDVISGHVRTDEVVLVECLSLWLSNLLMAERDVETHIARLVETLKAAHGQIIFVSSEVGLGVVPANVLARRFADLAGDLNQRMARIATRVVLVAAGLPLILKGNLPL